MMRLFYVVLIAFCAIAGAVYAVEPVDHIVVRGVSWGASQEEVSRNRNVSRSRDSLDLTDLLVEKDFIGLVPVSVEYGFFKNKLYAITIESATEAAAGGLDSVFLEWKNMLIEKYGAYSSEGRNPDSGPFYFHTLSWRESGVTPGMALESNVLNGKAIVVRIRYLDPTVYFHVEELGKLKFMEDQKKKF